MGKRSGLNSNLSAVAFIRIQLADHLFTSFPTQNLSWSAFKLNAYETRRKHMSKEIRMCSSRLKHHSCSIGLKDISCSLPVTYICRKKLTGRAVVGACVLDCVSFPHKYKSQYLCDIFQYHILIIFHIPMSSLLWAGTKDKVYRQD